MSLTSPPGSKPSAPWATSFERPLRILYLVVVIFSAGESLAGSFAGDWALGAPAVLLGLVVLAGSAVAVAVRGFNTPTVIILWFGLFAAQSWWLASVSSAGGATGAWWVWQPWIAAAILTGATCSVATTAAVLSISTVACAALGRMAGVSGLTMALQLISIWQAGLLVALVTAAWRRIARAGDIAATLELRETERRLRRSARARQEHLAARAVHDQVLHALRAANVPSDVASTSEIRSMAAAAARVFDAGADGQSAAGLANLLRGVIAEVPIEVDLDITDDLECADRPDPVDRAIAHAVREALRNVQRHSGLRRAAVRARCVDGTTTVEVVDDGVGFDPQAVNPRSRGLADSIGGAMRDIGGSAMIHSTPGTGTTVEVRWSAPEFLSSPTEPRSTGLTAVESGRAEAMVDMAHMRRNLLLAVIVPEVLGGLARSALALPTASSVAPVLVGTAVGLGAIAFGASTVWRERSMTPAGSAILAVLAIVAVALAGRGLDITQPASTGLAIIEVVTPVMMILAWQRPLPESLVAGVACGVVAAIYAAPSVPGVSGYLPIILLAPLAPIELLVLRHFVNRDSVKVDRLYETRKAAAVLQAAEQADRIAEATRMQRLRPLVLPTLESLADGTLSPANAATRARINTVEAAVRDDIQLGENLTELTRHAIEQARMDDVRVDLVGSPVSRSVHLERCLEELVMWGLDGPWTPSHITITVSSVDGSPDNASLSMLMRPGIPQEVARPHGTVLSRPEFTLIKYDVAAEF